MITLNDQVMAFMATRTDIQSASQITAQCKGNASAIAMALTKLVRAGKLKRVDRGYYAMPGAIAANIAFASISAAPKAEPEAVRPPAPAAADQDPDDDEVTVEVLEVDLDDMAVKKQSTRNSDRPNGKASKKKPKMFDPQKRRLVSL